MVSYIKAPITKEKAAFLRLSPPVQHHHIQRAQTEVVCVANPHIQKLSHIKDEGTLASVQTSKSSPQHRKQGTKIFTYSTVLSVVCESSWLFGMQKTSHCSSPLQVGARKE